MKSEAHYLRTDRLLLRSLEDRDCSFILKLVNTKGWLAFIGDRNINTEKEALEYIQKINDNKDITYWVVELEAAKIGVVTLIKRDHLSFNDIGFAFLPDFQGRGYAYEASNAILEQIIETSNHPTILAITKPDNLSSIKLIRKLGFAYDQTMDDEGEPSKQYSLNLEKLRIDRLIKQFFSAFTNKGTKPKLNLIYETCVTQTIIIKNTNGLSEVYDLPNFVSPREALLPHGQLQNFEEYEIAETTVITRNIAQRFSRYQKEGMLNNKPFSEQGNKMFHLIKASRKWKICSVIWDDESSD